jgi:hypothetical protein
MRPFIYKHVKKLAGESDDAGEYFLFYYVPSYISLRVSGLRYDYLSS